MFTDDNKVIQFKAPKVFGSFQNKTMLFTGSSETKDLKDCFAEVITEISPQQLENLKKMNVIPEDSTPEVEAKKEEQVPEFDKQN